MKLCTASIQLFYVRDEKYCPILIKAILPCLEAQICELIESFCSYTKVVVVRVFGQLLNSHGICDV